MLALPQTAEYALRGVSYIAEHEAGGPVPLPTVAAALDAPRNYLSKTLYQLGLLGVLRAERGVRGGYRLGRPPERLRLLDIVGPFLPATEHHCVMGRVVCRDDEPCGAHPRWKQVRVALESFLTEMTLADLLAGGKSIAPAADESDAA
jgi:Rrf2 family protein